ncbi:MAG: hypothetical protein NTU53_25125 [Planctomycetota bacterium]|nr:hypothetical protein [Planctomycetota bacterium]
MRFSRWLLSAVMLALAGAGSGCATKQPLVSVIADRDLGPAAAHGSRCLMAALKANNVPFEKASSAEQACGRLLIVAGMSGGDGPASRLLNSGNHPLPQGPEALIIRKTQVEGKPTWLIVGSDDRGLMYALLDVADRISWSTNPNLPLGEVRDTSEKPAVPERAMSIYTMNRAYWESRFYDESYWTRYLDTLARNRFNSLVIIFGYENGGFLAPAYPYFFDVGQFPDVRMVGITPQQQQRNLAALNHLIGMAHDRGVRVTLGLWDHIYRGGVQGGGIPGANRATNEPTAGLVWGVTEKNLVPYTKAALAELVRRVPDLDAIQFRMHDESGLRNSEQQAFWRDVFVMMKQAAPKLRLDLRAKGLPDSVIATALDVGIPFRITTKYWMEQMGMPFHPTHINVQNQRDRRHSYADMLRYPQQYRMHWRLWNGGTARVLLWADPDYARRFVDSTHLYDGDGFEVNEPLATKMEAQPHDIKPFDLLKQQYRYYDYEFERYWHFFQVFGRLGYNPNTPAEVWQHEFQRRFGPDAAPCLEMGLHRASQVLPRIVAACYPYGSFPMTRGWAERQRLGDLPAYAKAEGSDIQQFASFDEEAQILIDSGETAKTRPPQTSRWFAQTAADVFAQVAEAEKRVGKNRNKEFDSTVVDLRILANLALFHSRRIPAAVTYRLFDRTKDPLALDQAIAHERNAIDAWRQLVAAAGDLYTHDLMMGVRGASLCGHWQDELIALEKGLAALEQQRAAISGSPSIKPAPRYRPVPSDGDVDAPSVAHARVDTAPAGKPLTLSASVQDASGVKWVRLRYRSVNQHDDYRTLPMLPSGQAGRYEATVPAEHIAPTFDFMYFIETMDTAGNGRIYPNLNKETPYIVVRLTG